MTTNYQRQQKGKQGQSSVRLQGQIERKSVGSRESQERAQQRLEGDKIDSIFGFERLKEGSERLGWLLNYLPMSMPDETGLERSGMDLYFIDREGGSFKATVFHSPYFFIDFVNQARCLELQQHLLKKFEGCSVSVVEKEDLDMANHLVGNKHKFIKLVFRTVSEMMEAKNVLRPLVTENQKRIAATDDEDFIAHESTDARKGGHDLPTSLIVDLREHDLTYPMRVSIDLELRVGSWFVVTPEYGSEVCSVAWQKDMLELCEPRILAFDIECEKSPLKFPNPQVDRIYMISYMTAESGYLLVNRDVVSEDIAAELEYTPKPAYPGRFKVFNLADEESLLQFFLQHMQELRPHVFVTYNGDKFDWPYVEIRCSKYPAIGSLYSQLGIKAATPLSAMQRGPRKRFVPVAAAEEGEDNGEDGSEPAVGAALFSDGEYTGRCVVHLDAFSWVQRDSYLPQGNQGLKAVTKHKLGYEPVEIDPEDMLRFARERPHYMASYSLSDAVATYYLYTTYVHNFIFSLSTIIPLASEDVLRKGSGTLCEALLMVEAYRGNIVCPNKQVDPLEAFHEGHLLDGETYIGGHVECLEAGVFRADIPAKFSLVPSALQQLIGNVDRDLTFTLEVEHGLQRSDVTNYDEVRQAIVGRLEALRDNPVREEGPIIYHLDVGAMYPNIILTNRLQPAGIVDTGDCAACDFNRAENNCKRPMNWTWRGEYSPASRNEYNAVKRQLSYERVPVPGESGTKLFGELSERDQLAMAKARLKVYSNRVYKKTKVTQVTERTSTVCMRENSFYVDTVKAFRDRRYDYKLLTKTWKGKKIAAEKAGDAAARKTAEDREVLMDSLQLAHKCILNSFYGYVMRKGARWRSMEMAGIVTHTGALLIKQARELVEQVGRPLELDTDGIWCILPASFPRDFKFTTRSSGNVSIGYPCAMLNADVHERYTNHQYQELSKRSAEGGVSARRYDVHSECSIFFELDGPYKAMVLPASPEEGKLLKKKYVVFNFDGSIAELKGFELKRRGELELVKKFQGQVFQHFLAGSDLPACYSAVGAVANFWLDVLDRRGADMDDAELLELISERKTISKTVEDYGDRKSTSLTTAGRLADFLGADMTKDKGLNCNLIISRLPAGAPVTERAIPVAIFSCEPAVKEYFLRKWLKDSMLDCEDFRDVVDWQYYKERLGKSVQKIITIPAGIQRVANPCPRVEHPVWLARSIKDRASGMRQTSIMDSMLRVAKQQQEAVPGARLLSGSERISMVTASLKAAREGQRALGDDQGPAGKKRALLSDSGGGAAEVGDLEDMLTAGGGRGAGLGVAHNFRATVAPADKTSAAEIDIDVEELVTEVAKVAVQPMCKHTPENSEELHSWLSSRKDQWKQLRAERRANRALVNGSGGGAGGARNYGNPFRGGTSVGSNFSNTVTNVTAGGGGPLSKKAVGVADYMRNAQLALTQHCWQVLELQETESPGEFRVWALTTPTQLQCVTMVIPRVLYVNVSGADAQRAAEQLGGVRVKRDLPHGKAGHTMFEISISEQKFLRNEKALNLFLSDAQVEGVYESQVPLYLRGILAMGCVTRCVNSRARLQQNSKFRLTDMEFVHSSSFPYLEPAVATFKRIYIYYANNGSSRGALGVLAVFMVDGTNAEEEAAIQRAIAAAGADGTTTPELPLSARSFVWLINGRGAATMDSPPPLQRIYRRFQPSDSATVKFTSTFASTSAEAFRLCNDKLMTYQRERHGPTVVVAQGGAMDSRAWRYNVPMLYELPMSVVPTNNSDSVYPAVGWQQFTCERLVQRFLIFPSWFRDRLRGARYAHIPVCNLGTDALTTIIDVVYSRQLVHNRHLLWCSEGSNTPDTGSSADATAGGGSSSSLLIEFENSASDSAASDSVINNTGVYRDICIELDVYGLAVCAVMSSGELDAEGLTALSVRTSESSAGGGGVDEEAPVGGGMASAVSSLSSDASCARAFNIFKAMVARCIEEVERRSDPISDAILTALYRYLCGYGNGLLSDPALHRVVYNLMTQLFKKLIGALRRLGTRVVYADFGRIIIATSKQDYAAAREYMDFILGAVCGREVFSLVQISIKGYWEQLLWLGPENYGGIPLLDPTLFVAAAADQEQQEEVDLTADEAGGGGDLAGTESAIEVLNDGESQPSPIEVPSFTAVEDPVVVPPAAPVVKQVKIASIFAKQIATNAEVTVNDDALGSDVTTNGVRAKVNTTKARPISAGHAPPGLSSEYDFLNEGGGGGLEGDLRAIKNTYRSQQSGGVKQRLHKKKKLNSSSKVRGLHTIREEGSDEEDGRGDSDASSTSSGTDSDLDADEYSYLADENGRSFDEHAEGLDDEEADDSGVVAHWNLATYYPAGAAEFFRFIIGEFMLQYKARRDELRAAREERLSGATQYTQKHEFALPLDDEGIAAAVTQHMKELLGRRFTTKMLEIIDTLNIAYPMLHHQQQHGASSAPLSAAEGLRGAAHSEVFPRRAGSHLRMTSPALEFVKSATHVMALDGSTREEVATLKRMLLAQLRVREFSDESQFADPCLSFVLRDVICGFCSTCRDLDLLRDAALTCEDEDRRWRCSHCANVISVEEVENRLLDETDKLAAGFLLQDLRCSKTHRVSQRLCTAISDLCEPLVMDVSARSVSAKLVVLLKVAQFHKFAGLEVAVRDLLQ